MPWNDAPADSEAPVGDAEPEPAEVMGEDGEEQDAAAGRAPERHPGDRPDTLDERLAEEEPDAPAGPAADSWAGDLVNPQRGGGDVYRSEADHPGDGDEPGAEEAAIHLRDDSDL